MLFHIVKICVFRFQPRQFINFVLILFKSRRVRFPDPIREETTKLQNIMTATSTKRRKHFSTPQLVHQFRRNTFLDSKHHTPSLLFHCTNNRGTRRSLDKLNSKALEIEVMRVDEFRSAVNFEEILFCFCGKGWSSFLAGIMTIPLTFKIFVFISVSVNAIVSSTHIIEY